MTVQCLAIFICDGLCAIKSLTREVEVHELETVGSAAGKAHFALPAWGERENHRVTGFEGRHACTDLFDCIWIDCLACNPGIDWFDLGERDGLTDACRFMTWYHGRLEHEAAFLCLNVCMAY